MIVLEAVGLTHNWFCIIENLLFTVNVLFSNNIYDSLTLRRGILYSGFQVLNGTLYFTDCYECSHHLFRLFDIK